MKGRRGAVSCCTLLCLCQIASGDERRDPLCDLGRAVAPVDQAIIKAAVIDRAAGDRCRSKTRALRVRFDDLNDVCAIHARIRDFCPRIVKGLLSTFKNCTIWLEMCHG